MPFALVRGAFALVLALFFSALPVAASSLTTEQWREDLRVLDDALRTGHKSPFHTVTEEQHRASVKALYDAIPSMSDQEIIVEMAAIVVAVNDGHTHLAGWHPASRWGFARYPISLHLFSDGLFVRQAHPDQADLVGARITRIGDLDVDEALVRLGRVAPADNPYGRRTSVVHFARTPDVLVALGILASDGTTPYTFEKDGRTWSPPLRASEGADRHSVRGFVPDDGGYVDAMNVSDEDVPLWRRHIEETFWFEYLPQEKILYVQENQVRDAPNETLESFYARVWEAFEKNDVEKLVLDVRLNGGGNNYLNKPALTTMVRADASAQLYTIIGPQTFSACQNLVNQLSRWTDTIFVGEPTGERVNFYGDTRSIDLPHSGLAVRVSWLWWQDLDPRDTREALFPHLAADLSSADYAHGHDPAMEAVRTHDAVLDVDAALAMIRSEGLDRALDQLRDAMGDPVYRYRSLEATINSLGYRLMGGNELGSAIAVFELNAESFPDSWNVFDSLGEALELAGKHGEALESFRKSVALNPQSPSGLAAIERLGS